MRIDPVTGDRELVWHREVAGQGHTMGQCYREPGSSTSVQFNQRSFTMDPAGNFYLTVHDSFFGDGIVKIPFDGSTCTPIMRINGDAPALDIGGGANFQQQNIRGMAWVQPEGESQGLLYIYTVFGDRLYSVHPDTGFRALISSVDDNIGTSHPSIGENWLIWDDETDLLWTSGGAAEQFVAIDITTGDRQNLLQLSDAGPLVFGGHPVAHDVRGPLEPGTWARSLFFWDPENHDHIAIPINDMSIGIYEIHTSNSYMF